MKKVPQGEGFCKEWNPKNPLFIKIGEAAEMLGVCSRTIRRLSQLGELPPIVKIGRSARISYQAILDYAAKLNRLQGGAAHDAFAF